MRLERSQHDRRDAPLSQRRPPAADPFHLIGTHGQQAIQPNEIVGVGDLIDNEPLDPSFVAGQREPLEEVVAGKAPTASDQGPPSDLDLEAPRGQDIASGLRDPLDRRVKGRRRFVGIQAEDPEADGQPAKEQRIRPFLLAIVVQEAPLPVRGRPGRAAPPAGGPLTLGVSAAACTGLTSTDPLT